MKDQNVSLERAITIYRAHKGVLKTSEAIRAGIHPRTIYMMRDMGILEVLSRGIFRLADLPPLGAPDLVKVMLKVPKGVLCLISALAHHDMTTQIPHVVYVAIDRRTRQPKISYPPTRMFRIAPSQLEAGVEKYTVDNHEIRVYSPERTVVDCFKYRNKIGQDVALEALRLYKERGPMKLSLILKYAKMCRVENVMRPYLESAI